MLNNFTTCVEIVQFLFISVLCRIFVRYVKILLFEPSHLSYWVLQSANRCLADFCGALHCDYVDGLLNSKWKKTTCKPAVVDRNRHLCEVIYLFPQISFLPVANMRYLLCLLNLVHALNRGQCSAFNTSGYCAKCCLLTVVKKYR